MKEHPIPSNSEAERGILACLLAYPRQINRVVDILRAEHFLSEEHNSIYTAMLALHQHGKAATIFNVCDELKREQHYNETQLDVIGGVSYLEGLKESLLSLGKIEDYTDAVRHTSTFRRLYSFCAETAKDALHQKEGALEQAEQRLMEIALDLDIKQPSTLDGALEQYERVLGKRKEDRLEGKEQGITTGFRDLDKILTLRPSRLHVLAARPSVGKTALALNIAFNAVQHAKHALFFSLEMDEGELVQRLLAAETPLDQSYMDSGDITDAEYAAIQETRKRMAGLDLKLEDRVYLLPAIVAETKQVHMRKKLDLVVIDYLQIMDVPKEERGQARYQEVGKITKALKRLAKDIKAPVLLLAQLSRKTEEHYGGVPQLSDLYESGKIEQDTDVVLLAHVEEEEEKKRSRCEPYAVNILIRKHRNGRLGSVKLMFRPRLTKFDNAAPEVYSHA